jgi:hypothetical protein
LQTSGLIVIHDSGPRYTLTYGLTTPRSIQLNVKDKGDTIVAATSDVLIVATNGAETTSEADEGNTTVTWMDFATMVGVASTVEMRGGAAVPLPKPPGDINCAGSVDMKNQTNALVLCTKGVGYGKKGQLQFAVVWNATSVGGAMEAAIAALDTNVAELAGTRLSALDQPQTLSNATLDRLSRKVYSVMRVNTLAPEGPLTQRWSTPDRTPHRAMWLWDSCVFFFCGEGRRKGEEEKVEEKGREGGGGRFYFWEVPVRAYLTRICLHSTATSSCFHAFGRNLVDPGLAWEFLASMLQAQAFQGDTGRVPIEFEVWDTSDAHGNETQPPLLAWATWDTYQVTGNKSALVWAAPRLADYLSYDFRTRDRNQNGLLEWLTSFESGLDNSPIFDDVRMGGENSCDALLVLKDDSCLACTT